MVVWWISPSTHASHAVVSSHVCGVLRTGQDTDFQNWMKNMTLEVPPLIPTNEFATDVLHVSDTPIWWEFAACAVTIT